MTPDLAGLVAPAAWAHFTEDPEAVDPEADALERLRARLGASYATTPTDAELLAALGRAVAFLERATGRWFTVRTGTIKVDGTGTPRLFLPLPVVSEAQGGAGVTAITFGTDTTELDAEFYQANDGAGLPGRDPRDQPIIDLVGSSTGSSAFTSRPPGWEAWSSWPRGVRNVNVAASWGYVNETGATPELARQALALLTVRELTRPEDPDAREDLRRGALLSESTQGRSYTVNQAGTGAGLTTDRELDILIGSLRAPPVPRIPAPPNRRRATTRTRLLF
jgi:hypothetical protein